MEITLSYSKQAVISFIFAVVLIERYGNNIILSRWSILAYFAPDGHYPLISTFHLELTLKHIKDLCTFCCQIWICIEAAQICLKANLYS